MIGTRSSIGTRSIALRSFATEPSELAEVHVNIDRPMIAKLGGSTRMLPELSDMAEARVLERMFSNGRPLFEPDDQGHQAHYRRELDLTLDKSTKKFQRFESIPKLRRMPDGSFRSDDGKTFVPLVEGRMVGRYDIFQKSWVHGAGRTAIWESNRERSLRECTPQYVIESMGERSIRVAICDVTSATNTRTVHAALVPPCWVCGNTAPVLEFQTATDALSSLAVLNSLVFDWMTRRIVGGLHLNKFYLATLVWPRLNVEASGRLARMAIAMTKESFRAPSCISEWSGPESPHQQEIMLSVIEAAIEWEVAMAFKLNEGMLRRVLSPDRTDRRGFWRYFAAKPQMFIAIRDMLQSVEEKRPGSNVAA